MSRDRSLGPDRQKNRTGGQRRPDVAAERRRWQETQSLRHARVCFSMNVASTDLLRCYGRSPRGARLHDHTPCSHVRRTRSSTALRLDGLRAARRLRWAESRHRRSAPTWNKSWSRPGDVVVLDNLAVHKQPDVRDAIAAVSARVRGFCRPTVPTSIRSSSCSRNSSIPPRRARKLVSYLVACARPLRSSRPMMRQLRAPLRLPPSSTA